MQPPTKMNREAFRADIAEHADTLLIAQAHAKLLREQVDAIYRDVLAKVPAYCQYTGERITDHDRLWHAPEDQWRRVHNVADPIIREQIPGAADLPTDHCPALVAETHVIESKWALCAAAEPHTGVSHDDLLRNGVAKVDEYVDLMVKIVVLHPAYRKPDLAAI